MAQNAYCSECGTRVRLTESGECAAGHPRSALRDVREGEPAAVTTAKPSQPGATRPSDPNLTTAEEVAAKTIGRIIIIVPATIVLVVGLYSVYAVGVYMGQSKLQSWLESIGSMLLTAGIVALLVWDRRRKMRR